VAIVSPSLFDGVSGLGFAATQLSRDGIRYRHLLTALDRTLAPMALELGATLAETSGLGPVTVFDVISGASGIGVYLAERDPHEALPTVLRGLMVLAEPDRVPKWATPAEQLGDPSLARAYPAGALNCGLAHGITGPLALLAVALGRGVEVAGQSQAVKQLSSWLLDHAIADDWGINWPSAVPLSDARRGEETGTVSRRSVSRSSWCYGSPGIARALWLAGEALGDASLRNHAWEALRAVLRRPIEARQIDSPTFCHGVAGLLQIVLRFANDPGPVDDGRFNELIGASETLVDQLLAAHDPGLLLGYAALDPGPHQVDRAGLLDGAAGVVMTLLAAATDSEPTWDRLFLLS
jgi:hypothetical protein